MSDGALSAEPPPSGDAASLEVALRGEGFDVRVEADGRLALIVPSAAADALDARLRERAWPLARAAGFTHAAVELVDHGTRDDRATVPRD